MNQPGYTPSPGYGELLPDPPPFHASTFGAWFFLFWAGAFVVILAVPWAIKRFIRGDRLPALALLSGLFTSLGEPMLDHVGHLRWAHNLLGPAFVNFDLPIPVLIPPCYMLFMGLESYWIWLVIQRGIDRKRFFMMYAACGLSDAVMEHPGLILNVYEYYGRQPLEFYKFPFYWSFTNGVAIATIAVVIHYAWPLVKDKGWKQLYIVPIGLIATTVGEFGSGFPVFLAINASIPTWVQWAIGCLTVPLSLLWIRVLSDLVCTEKGVPWTFWGLFKSRFMLPQQRERYINSIGWDSNYRPDLPTWPPNKWLARRAAESGTVSSTSGDDPRESVRV